MVAKSCGVPVLLLLLGRLHVVQPLAPIKSVGICGGGPAGRQQRLPTAPSSSTSEAARAYLNSPISPLDAVDMPDLSGSLEEERRRERHQRREQQRRRKAMRGTMDSARQREQQHYG